MAGVWVALEDIDEDNGPLVYYPGRHKLHEYSMDDFDLEPGYHNYHKYEERIQQLVEKEKLEGEYGVIKKGDALIWQPKRREIWQYKWIIFPLTNSSCSALRGRKRFTTSRT